MKKRNWKVFRRVVLILLIVGITVCSIIRSNTLSVSGANDFPPFKLECYDKQYPLDDATVNLHIGNYDFTDTSAAKCLAFYYCTLEDFPLHAQTEAVADYHFWDDHYFFKEISVSDAKFGPYATIKGIFGNTHYFHSEKLTIPRTVLEACNGELCIVIVTVSEEDGKQYISSNCNYLTIRYTIVNDRFVQFYF